jgi:2-hydroxy-6-oxonona-2,4-dienedioate hydrolase
MTSDRSTGTVGIDAIYEQPEGRLVPAGEHEMFVVERGDPSGEPVIFLHGGPGVSGWTNFGPTMPFVQGSGRRLLVVDMLQYGRSSKPAFSGPQWAWHARYVVQMMDSLGLERADFVCNSTGGSVALCLAADFPGRARKLVITGSTPMARGAAPASEEFQLAGRTAMASYLGGEGPTWEKARGVMATFEWYDESRIPDAAVALRLQESLRPDLLALGASRDRRGTPEDLEEKLRLIEAPILFLWGRHDPFVVAQTYPVLLAETVQNGDVYLMDDVGHHPSEERPAAYAPIVLGFLDRVEDLAR